MKRYEHGYKCSRDPLVTEHEDTRKNKKRNMRVQRGLSGTLQNGQSLYSFFQKHKTYELSTALLQECKLPSLFFSTLSQAIFFYHARQKPKHFAILSSSLSSRHFTSSLKKFCSFLRKDSTALFFFLSMPENGQLQTKESPPALLLFFLLLNLTPFFFSLKQWPLWTI